MSTLVLKNFSGFPEITPEAFSLKNDALALALPIKKVETEKEQSLAVNALQALKAISKGMEATRKAVKAPVLELGKKIDVIAANFLEEIDREELRLQGHINHYQRDQLRLKREAEEQQLREQVEAQRLKDEAERLRIEAEKTGRVDLMETAEQMETKALDAQMNQELAPGPLAVSKPKGLVVKQRLNFQISDALVFAQAYPEFWTWHEETETLKLKRRDILEELNKERGIFHLATFPEELPDQKDSRVVKPAGMRVYEETTSHVR